jgi:ABC-type cobalt transport system substrate-binding protein
VCLVAACTQAAQAPWPDVRYEPSSPEVVSAMLELAAVGPSDVVYDLGAKRAPTPRPRASSSALPFARRTCSQLTWPAPAS